MISIREMRKETVARIGRFRYIMMHGPSIYQDTETVWNDEILLVDAYQRLKKHSNDKSL